MKPHIEQITLSRRATPLSAALFGLAVAASCGAPKGTSKSAAAFPATTDEVRVYAWSGNVLEGVYCVRNGTLDAERCQWPERLQIPLDAPIALHRRVQVRENITLDRVRVATYEGENPTTEPVVLVVESASGVSAWTAPLADSFNPASHAWPSASPRAAIDNANIPAFASVAVHMAEEQDVLAGNSLIINFELEVKDGDRSWVTGSSDNRSTRKPFAYPAFDLDRDREPEVIYLATEGDEIPAHIEVRELSIDAAATGGTLGPSNARTEPFRVRHQFVR
jgi:hypothetical protein